MSPMMFSALPPPGVELGSSPAAGDRSLAAGPSPLLTEPPASGEGDLAEVTPLTRRQLLQAFTYLIKVGTGRRWDGRKDDLWFR